MLAGEVMARNDADLNRKLGEVVGEVRTLRTTIERQDERASEARSKLFSAVEKLTRRQINTEAALKSMQRDIEDMRPTVDRFKDLENQGLGVLATLSRMFRFINWIVVTIAAALGALASEYWERAVNLITGQ